MNKDTWIDFTYSNFYKREIYDISDILEKHPNKKFDKKNIENIKYLVIHQSLSKPNNVPDMLWWQTPQIFKDQINDNVEKFRNYFENIFNINRYHITPAEDNHISKTGCPKICYHFAIEQSGVIFKCNDIEDITWSVKDHNMETLNILVIGNFDAKSHPGDSPNRKQQISMINFIKNIIKYKLFEINHIVGHSFYGKENCPGTYIEAQLFVMNELYYMMRKNND